MRILLLTGSIDTLIFFYVGRRFDIRDQLGWIRDLNPQILLADKPLIVAEVAVHLSDSRLPCSNLLLQESILIFSFH